MYVAMATVVLMNYPLPLKQGTSFLIASVKTGYAYVSYMSSLCNCIRIKFTETRHILEILLFLSNAICKHNDVNAITSLAA